MERQHRREPIRWLAYLLLGASLIAAVVLSGGVDPSQWQWIAATISIGSLLCLIAPARHGHARARPEFFLLALIAAWMALQLLPLPPGFVKLISPERWNAVSAARTATGADVKAWLPISVAPAATFEQLLYVIPAMAAFVAAGELAYWRRGRHLWLVLAPLVVAASIESLLGLFQYLSVQAAGPDTEPVRGSYANRNHFAGLLEMALPITLMWAVASWKKVSRHGQPGVLKVCLLAALATSMLVSILASVSRMGFAAALAAITTVIAACVFAKGRASRSRFRKWFWLIPVLLPVLIAASVSTNAMLLRFAALGELDGEGRLQIWRDTAHMLPLFKWTGCGLGAFEHGLYRFRTFAPVNSVNYAHNDYLQLFAELGVIGTFLIGALTIIIVRRALLAALTPETKHWAVAVGLLAALVAIGLHSIVDFNLYIPANALALAWSSGIAASPALGET